MASKLLDFSQDLDVPLLDATVSRFYAGSNEEARPGTAARRDGSAHLLAGRMLGLLGTGGEQERGSRARLCLAVGRGLDALHARAHITTAPQLAATLAPSACHDSRARAAYRQRIASESVLRELQKHPEAWTRVDRILELSQSQQSKFIALQVRRAVHGRGCGGACCVWPVTACLHKRDGGW